MQTFLLCILGILFISGFVFLLVINYQDRKMMQIYYKQHQDNIHEAIVKEDILHDSSEYDRPDSEYGNLTGENDGKSSHY